MKSLLDPTFKYTSAVKTDIRKTFRRIRERQRLLEEEQQKQEPTSCSVLSLPQAVKSSS